jgi:predicted nucleotidyltransferase
MGPRQASPPCEARLGFPTPVTAPILSGVAAQLEEALSTAALNETERRAVARIVDFLEEQLGEDLLAVWLYGSRARGEADPTEADPDRRSDIDLIAIVASGRDAGEASWELRPRWEALVAAEGDSPPYFSLRFYDADFLRDRRRIRDFFFQEVDRDKLVLAGGDLEGEEHR